MSPRVCLIVDNPNRDLAGLSITAAELARRGIETHLVPMYDQLQHIVDIKPNLVVVNFVREFNAEFIKLYNKMGIIVAVLDTEGAVFINADEVISNLKVQEDALSKVSLYMVWGDYLLATYKQTFSHLANIKFVVTGVPRTDFYHQDFSSSTEPPLDRDYILLPTNYPIVNSNFESTQTEIKNAQKVQLASDSIWKERTKALEVAWQRAMAVYEKLLQNHPHQFFVIRPHPFESTTCYEERFAPYANVMIILDDRLHEWLNHAKLILHLNCSTGLEAAMLGNINLSFDWMQNDLVKMPIVDQCSIKISSPEELDQVVRFYLTSGKLPAFLDERVDEAKRNLDSVIADWYHAIDGKSYLRVVDQIEAAISERDLRPNPSGHSLWWLLHCRLKRFLSRIYFLPKGRRANKMARRKRKAFCLKMVNEKLERIKFVTQPLTSETVLNSSDEIFVSHRVNFHP